MLQDARPLGSAFGPTREKRMQRRYTLLDQTLCQVDTVLKTLHGNKTNSNRANPAVQVPEQPLTSGERKHSAGLMRVNHTGEVCAQALYQGQGLTAKLPHIRQEMQQAAIEEEDHLAWCQERLNELGSKPSRLNPVWYGLSFCIGAGAGAISDKLSLGFVAATEDQVCKHLQEHMQGLPEQDLKSRAIIEQMHNDEAEHAALARKAGGVEFPRQVKKAMSQVAKLMTTTSYRI